MYKRQVTRYVENVTCACSSRQIRRAPCAERAACTGSYIGLKCMQRRNRRRRGLTLGELPLLRVPRSLYRPLVECIGLTSRHLVIPPKSGLSGRFVAPKSIAHGTSWPSFLTRISESTRDLVSRARPRATIRPSQAPRTQQTAPRRSASGLPTSTTMARARDIDAWTAKLSYAAQVMLSSESPL